MDERGLKDVAINRVNLIFLYGFVAALNLDVEVQVSIGVMPRWMLFNKQKVALGYRGEVKGLLGAICKRGINLEYPRAIRNEPV